MRLLDEIYTYIYIYCPIYNNIYNNIDYYIQGVCEKLVYFDTDNKTNNINL